MLSAISAILASLALLGIVVLIVVTSVCPKKDMNAMKATIHLDDGTIIRLPPGAEITLTKEVTGDHQRDLSAPPEQQERFSDIHE